MIITEDEQGSKASPPCGFYMQNRILRLKSCLLVHSLPFSLMRYGKDSKDKLVFTKGHPMPVSTLLPGEKVFICQLSAQTAKEPGVFSGGPKESKVTLGIKHHRDKVSRGAGRLVGF